MPALVGTKAPPHMQPPAPLATPWTSQGMLCPHLLPATEKDWQDERAQSLSSCCRHRTSACTGCFGLALIVRASLYLQEG